MTWYAVAFDVAGGIADWSGPMRWSRARLMARRWDRADYVRATVVSESPPCINKRYLRESAGV